MKRLWRWILLAVVLGGLAVAAAVVPIGGRTVLDRITGHQRNPAAAPAGRPEPAVGAADRLTDKDREGLNKLIESKLDEPAQEGGEAKAPPQK